jgi:putative ABC transport system substrate-binding protein
MVILSILAAPLATEAQQPTKVYRIGYLTPGSAPLSQSTPLLNAFRQRLRELGYVEGQNLVIEERYAEGNEERLHDLTAELVRLKMDVIVANARPGVSAAQHATRTIPIVMTGHPDPVADGLVASLARPGGNITGLSNMSGVLFEKRLELLKETRPQSTHIAVLFNTALVYTVLVNNLTVAAQTLKLQLHVAELRSAEELDPTFVAMTQAGVEALLVVGEPQLIAPLSRQIADLAIRHRLPTMCSWKPYVDDGCLMSYGPSLPDMFRRVADYVDKILKGSKPADLPVEQPMKFELVINLKTAKALGLTIPPTLLFQADEVIR